MRLLAVLVLLLFSRISRCQTDDIGSGRTLNFDGINDYVEVGNYKNINFPFTISAWIFLDPSAASAPIFSTNDNNPLYRGFWFSITPNVIQCEFGDGTGGNNPAFRQGKIASISNVVNRWVHVCAIVSSSA